MVTITRPQNEAEKKNFKDLKSWRQDDFMQQSLAKIAKIEQEHIHGKNRRPYCSKCAYETVQRKINNIEEAIARKKSRRGGTVEVDVRIDFEQFGDSKKFKVIKEEDWIDDILQNGVKVPIKLGIEKDYECVDCGAGLTIQYRQVAEPKPIEPGK